MADERNPASKILRERAMAILRNTRAKIDPKLLSAMKDQLSPAAMPKKDTVFKREEPQPETAAAPVPKSESSSREMEPVDRQKVAQIVLQYMKNREDKQKH